VLGAWTALEALKAIEAVKEALDCKTARPPRCFDRGLRFATTRPMTARLQDRKTARQLIQDKEIKAKDKSLR